VDPVRSVLTAPLLRFARLYRVLHCGRWGRVSPNRRPNGSGEVGFRWPGMARGLPSVVQGCTTMWLAPDMRPTARLRRCDIASRMPVSMVRVVTGRAAVVT